MTDETALYIRVHGEIVLVKGRSAVLGRSKSCDVQLDVHGVSRRHCEVLLRADGASVRDLGSTHGTWIDGRRIAAEERVGAGAVVRLGAHGPQFELVNAIVHGRPVLGRPNAPAPPAAGARSAADDERTAEAPAAMRAAAAAASAPPARAGGFLSGLAWGVVAGIAVGVAALALFDVRL